VAEAEWIWMIFLFVFGCCIGSFLNVVIYRMPRDESLIRPGSHCPSCNSAIRFYDNIPLVSWLVLGGRCRVCKSRISARYFFVELLTGVVFAGVFVLYFVVGSRSGVGGFSEGGWFVYLAHIVLLSGLLAASAIDLQLWVIPLAICWFLTGAGILASSVAGFVIDSRLVSHYRLFPRASAATGALAAGAVVGLAVSLGLLALGVIKRSYVSRQSDEAEGEQTGAGEKQDYKHRIEVLREIVFLLPVIVCSLGAFYVSRNIPAVRDWWLNFSQGSVVSGLLGGIWGYFAGCGVVWATRILGTIVFGKEAMGLGDVHLMGAAGAVIGWEFVIIAFFIAPFFGLSWALYQMFFRKTRQIPYGPFLSMAVFGVMIFHDQVINRLWFLFIR